MRLFTLTDGTTFKEIFKLEEEKLIQREDVVAWVRTMQQRARAESESIGCVFDGHIYNDEFLGPSCQLKAQFPFDIINIDFVAQGLLSEQGKIERELEKLEKIIALQNQMECNKFVLIYTTSIDAHEINATEVIRTSDSSFMNGWAGLGVISPFNLITDLNQKQKFIRDLFERLIQKYKYKCAPHVVDDTQLFSIVGIIVR
jgi:hypothetical protein